MTAEYFSDDTTTTLIEWGVRYKDYRAIDPASSEAWARAWVDYANTHGVPAVLFSRTITYEPWREAS